MSVNCLLSAMHVLWLTVSLTSKHITQLIGPLSETFACMQNFRNPVQGFFVRKLGHNLRKPVSASLIGYLRSKHGESYLRPDSQFSFHTVATRLIPWCKQYSKCTGYLIGCRWLQLARCESKHFVQAVRSALQ